MTGKEALRILCECANGEKKLLFSDSLDLEKIVSKRLEKLEKLEKVVERLKKWYLPCGVEFETEEYEEFDDDGELITVIEYYMIDKNTDELYDLNGLEEFRFMKEVFGNENS